MLCPLEFASGRGAALAGRESEVSPGRLIAAVLWLDERSQARPVPGTPRAARRTAPGLGCRGRTRSAPPARTGTAGPLAAARGSLSSSAGVEVSPVVILRRLQACGCCYPHLPVPAQPSRHSSRWHYKTINHGSTAHLLVRLLSCGVFAASLVLLRFIPRVLSSSITFHQQQNAPRVKPAPTLKPT